MKTTVDNNPLQIVKIKKIFKKVIKDFFIDSWVEEEMEIHALCMQLSRDKKTVYYDKEQLPETIIQDKLPDIDSKFVKAYVQEKMGEKDFILEQSQASVNEGCLCMIYWIFSFGRLDHNHGKLAVKTLFRQFAEQLNQLIANADSENAAIQEEDLIQNTENVIQNELEKLFAPFKATIVQNLSGEYYEKSECQSNLAFLPHGVIESFTPEDFKYHFKKNDFSFHDKRLIRKLLQITQNDLCLVLGADESNRKFEVLGICNKDVLANKMKAADGADIPYLRVEIKKHMQWDIFLNDKYILTAQNGHYKISYSLQKDYLVQKLTNYFGESEDAYNLLIENILRAKEQKHGTMLVIMEPAVAEKEVRRLGDADYGFAAGEPLVLTEHIEQFGAIDGSIMMDTAGKVYGVGMILDGFSGEKGNIARGSRYNSALKYPYFGDPQKTSTGESGSLAEIRRDLGKVMIVIYSEDGTVDMIEFGKPDG
ncbi:MAG: hypothetical protein NC419_10060 [Muribaculaceae bacterium]|nr:hypothetical protein [Muribaculaceae bacterium]